MKIFYLITKSEPGGVQTHIFQLSKSLKEKGSEVSVMSSPGGWLEKEIKKLGIKFYPNEELSNTFNPIKNFLAFKKIKKAIFNFKPDIVSCHSTKAGFLGRLAVRNKIPTIFTAHGWAFTPGTALWKKLLILTEKLVARFCQKIICVSEFDRQLAIKYKISKPQKIIVIHNGTEISEVQNLNQFKNPPIKIVFLGRLAKPKDPLLLLKTFSDLNLNLKKSAEILIIGDGPLRKEVENFLKKQDREFVKKIKLLGELPREDVLKTLKKAQIFVLTSNWEGFPRSILEAMSYGLAIIASDVGGTREAVGDCGILIKRNNKKELKEALTSLLKNSYLIQKMGEKARQKVKEKFSLERMIKATERVYNELFSETKNI